MDLTPGLVESEARAYEAEAPLHAVEVEQLETLPAAVAAGEYGWRDAMWIVRWYYRRFLGAVPDQERRAAEDVFGENEYETIRAVLEDVVTSSTDAERVERLTDLAGVDVRVASAFLFFIEPSSYLVVGEREWRVLRDGGELAEPYPDPPAIEEYETYLASARGLSASLDCDLWTLYRAIWRLSAPA